MFIWSTTKNIALNNNFHPKTPDLKCIWHRTRNSKSKCKYPDYYNNIPYYIMYKTPFFKENFKQYLNENNFCMKGTSIELCTGLLTILTATLFFKNINIYGFTFYNNSNLTNITYYRNKQLDKSGNHYEDKEYKDNIKNGFISRKIFNTKIKIINDLINNKKIKQL